MVSEGESPAFCGAKKPEPQRHFQFRHPEGRARKPLRANCFKLKNSRKGDVRRSVRRFVERRYTPSIREVRVHVFSRFAAAAAIASLAAFPAHAADITVGLITSLTGPGASIGIPHAK